MSFAADISSFVERTGLRADQVLRKVGLDGYGGLQRRSPVDTGRFRANWRISIDQTDLTTTEDDSSGEAGSPPTSDELAVATSTLEKARFGQSIHLSNNLPYAGPLENGHSQQAPNGIVSQTLLELQANLERALAGLDA